MQKIGKGMLTSGAECTGTLREVDSVPDVLRLMSTDLSDVILYMKSASVTAVTPLCAKIKGVICTAGGPTSHLAIVAREFDLPCVMASEIDFQGTLDGQTVTFNREGDIFLES
jgi:phosphoenolpyruvate-protein kinase (PTS system EI component)